MQNNTPETRTADAIDRVLEAERATAAAIADAQAAAQASIEAARETRRLILEQARERVLRLHERAQQRLDETLCELDARAAASQVASDTELAGIAEAAVAGVAARLTTDTTA
jgi:hypothetical protein